MKRDLGLDIESLHPEVARAYGLTVSARRAPSVVLIVSRFIGWLGICVWLGGLVTVQFVVTPQVTTTMAYMAPLLRNTDWASRAVFSIVGSSLYTISLVALGLVVFLILLGMMELRVDPGRRLVSRLPLIIAGTLAAEFVYSQDVRYDMYSANPGQFVNMYGAFNLLMDLQIALLVLLALALVWAQTANTSLAPE